MTEPSTGASRASDPSAIRAVSLPRRLRGFDEDATRRLLTEVATVIESLTSERETLRRQVESLQAAASVEPTPEACGAEESGDHESPEALGNAILAAKHAGEELNAAAREEADSILAAAAAEADRLVDQARAGAAEVERELAEDGERLERERVDHARSVAEWTAKVKVEREAMIAEARAEAESMLTEGEDKLEQLKRKQEGVQRFIAKEHARFVSMLESALAQLDPLVGVEDQTEGASGDLPAALRSRVGSRDEA